MSPTAKSLGLWTHPSFPGWIAMPGTNKDDVHVWKAGQQKNKPLFFLRSVVLECGAIGECLSFTTQYFRSHPNLCADLAPVTDNVFCTRESGHIGVHTAVTGSTSFTWEG